MSTDLWFTSRWEAATEAKREAAWVTLIDLFDQVDEGGAGVSPEIRAFLHDRCLDGWPGMVGDTDTASRLLALLMESGHLPDPWKSYETFKKMVLSDDRRRRYRGVTAAWLSDDRWFVGLLAGAYQHEANPTVKDFMRRAVSAMGDWSVEQHPHVIRYRDLVHRMRAAAAAGDEDREDALLDELDALWWSALTEDERSYINNPGSK